LPVKHIKTFIFMKKVIPFALFFCIFFPLSAQYTISSRIIDTETKEVVEFAAVQLLNAKDTTFVGGAQTDLDGKFQIENVKSGNYILSISFLGYHLPKTNANSDLPLEVSDRPISSGTLPKRASLV
jgi:hypothetical protein